MRMRRLRSNPAIRSIVTETRLYKDDLIAPVFVNETRQTKRVASLPNHPQWCMSDYLKHLERFAMMGGKTVLLFGIPAKKDPLGKQAYGSKGVVQEALRAARKQFGHDLVLAADLCFCEYTDHGHCGILRKANGKGNVVSVDNDATLTITAKTAVSLAEAGADIVAPSGMMDGHARAIREALEADGFKDTLLMSYSAKYSSGLYGPFRDVAESAPSAGDRRGYQMHPASSKQAMREIALDVAEGADIVMVKPAMFYLDIIAKAKASFDVPLAAYQVSGEAWMVDAYAKAGMARREDIVLESVLAVKRAGADLIITYFAEELLPSLR